MYTSIYIAGLGVNQDDGLLCGYGYGSRACSLLVVVYWL